MSTANDLATDGIHRPVPREEWSEDVRRLRDAYNRVPGAPLYHCEFGYYCLDKWKEQGLPEDVDFAEYFHYNQPGKFALEQLGWCEAAFYPTFTEEVIEDRGDTEVVRDYAGRHVLFFKGRRSGFMPEYLECPVKDMKTWQEDVKWRLAPNTPERNREIEKKYLPPWRRRARAGLSPSASLAATCTCAV